LRFFAGQQGADAIEQVAILNINSPAVLLGIEPHRVGDKVSTWTWDDGKIVVASIDGVTDEFIIRADKSKEEKVAKGDKDDGDKPKRRVASESSGGGGSSTKSSNQTPAWAPWSQGSSSDRQPQRTAQQPRPANKPKTFFDMLLGN
jgi:hypothetical protein